MSDRHGPVKGGHKKKKEEKKKRVVTNGNTFIGRIETASRKVQN